MAGITSSSRSIRGKRGDSVSRDSNSPEHKSQQETVTRRDSSQNSDADLYSTAESQFLGSDTDDYRSPRDYKDVGLHSTAEPQFLKKGGKVSASKRADGIAQRGKTRGKYL